MNNETLDVEIRFVTPRSIVDEARRQLVEIGEKTTEEIDELLADTTIANDLLLDLKDFFHWAINDGLQIHLAKISTGLLI